MYTTYVIYVYYFDNLINRIDIDIESSLEKYSDKQLLSEMLKNSEDNRWCFRNIYKKFNIEFFETFDSSKPNLESWPESTKVVDYLNQVRMKTIEKLKRAQEETLEYYKRFKGELFAQKFYFQINFKKSEKRLWPFNVFTFVTDFYISQSNIDSLE